MAALLTHLMVFRDGRLVTAYGAGVIPLEVMTDKEFNARERFQNLLQLVSLAEAAEMLCVSRQAALDRIRSQPTGAQGR